LPGVEACRERAHREQRGRGCALGQHLLGEGGYRIALDLAVLELPEAVLQRFQLLDDAAMGGGVVQ
jgi:hypothetical protein